MRTNALSPRPMIYRACFKNGNNGRDQACLQVSHRIGKSPCSQPALFISALGGMTSVHFGRSKIDGEEKSCVGKVILLGPRRRGS